MGTEEDKPFGVWLRREMQRRGYDLEGPRAGGRTRLAKETGLSLSIISRILNDNRVPEVKALRSLGDALGYSLTEMLVHAGMADREDLPPSVTPSREPRVVVPHWVSLRDLSDWEQHIWVTPGLTVEQRQAAVLLVRLQRGDLDDDTEGLLRLYHAIGDVVGRHLERSDPPRAV